MRKHQESSPWNLEPTRWICLGLPYMEPDSNCGWYTWQVKYENNVTEERLLLRVVKRLDYKCRISWFTQLTWQVWRWQGEAALRVPDLSYSDFTAPCRSRIKLHQNRKMSQVIAAAFGFVIAHPFYLTSTSWPPNRAKKKKEKKYISLYFWKSFLPNSNCFILKGLIHYLHKP